MGACSRPLRVRCAERLLAETQKEAAERRTQQSGRNTEESTEEGINEELNKNSSAERAPNERQCPAEPGRIREERIRG
jgi:hypothetical protein